MSGESIVLSIRSLGYDKAAELNAQAQQQADEALAEARAKQEASAARYVEARVEQARNAALRAEHAAQIANGRLLAEVKSEFLQRVALTAREQLEHMRESSAYRTLLRDLCLDALERLEACATLHVDARDKALTDDLLEELQAACPGVEIATDIKTSGGVIAQTADGKISCDNTFEARLMRENTERANDIWKVLQQ